jgi:glycerate kinase
MSGLAQQLESADLVITGEGSFDYQSLSGKVVDGIGRAALAVGVPVVVVAGRVDLGRREWQTIGIHGVYSLSEMVGEESAMFDSVAAVQSAMARVARTWGR